MMKMLIANWKASMTKPQAQEWVTEFLDLYNKNNLEIKLKENNAQIVICPPFPLVPIINYFVGKYNEIAVGSQTVSAKKSGPFTGEVTAELLKEDAKYAIIGHSERREHFHETEEQIEQQIQNCVANNITSILCVRDENDKVYDNVTIVAYEPTGAIGSGHNADVNVVLEMKKKLNLKPETTFIYGGSVDEHNVTSYLESGEIHGFLVGTASLTPESFYNLVVAMV